jgi:NAD(P)-dependent dehydrogenase (short-subunit alcohol dehydrogenase family)
MPKLDNKTAVITGATLGMGLAAARLLAAEGAHVYITGRRKDRLDQAVQVIEAAAPGRVTGVQADSGSPADLDRLFSAVRDGHGRLDSSTPAPASARSPSRWRQSRPPRSTTCSA